MATVHPNGLLASLCPADLDALRPHLKTVELVQGAIIMELGDIIDRVYFPHNGIVSLIVPLVGGEMIETGLIGCDSIVGGSSALDGKVALNRAIVQIKGAASIVNLEHFRRLADQSVSFRTTLMRHEQMILIQAQQSAACNISHTVEERLARWLLHCRDLIGSNSLGLTQETIAYLLGVQRTSVSLVAGTLQRAGLINYRHGHILIKNVQGLRETSCECYETVSMQSDRLLHRRWADARGCHAHGPASSGPIHAG